MKAGRFVADVDVPRSSLSGGNVGITGRSKGHRITASRRIQLGRALRELLAKEPGLSIEELVKRTGSPYDMANFIRKRFKQEQEKAATMAANDLHAAKMDQDPSDEPVEHSSMFT